MSEILPGLGNICVLLFVDDPAGYLDAAASETVFAPLLDLVYKTCISALTETHALDIESCSDRVSRLFTTPCRTPQFCLIG